MAIVQEKDQNNQQKQGFMNQGMDDSQQLGGGGPQGDFKSTANQGSFGSPKKNALTANIGQNMGMNILGQTGAQLPGAQDYSQTLQTQKQDALGKSSIEAPDFSGIMSGLRSGDADAANRAESVLRPEAVQPDRAAIEGSFSDFETDTLQRLARGDVAGEFQDRRQDALYSSGMANFDAQVAQANPEFRRELAEQQERLGQLEETRQAAIDETVRDAQTIGEEQQAEYAQRLEDMIAAERDIMMRQAQDDFARYEAERDAIVNSEQAQNEAFRSIYDQAFGALDPELQQYAPNYAQALQEFRPDEFVDLGGPGAVADFMTPSEVAAANQMGSLINADPIFAGTGVTDPYSVDPNFFETLQAYARDKQPLPAIEDLPTTGLGGPGYNPNMPDSRTLDPDDFAPRPIIEVQGRAPVGPSNIFADDTLGGFHNLPSAPVAFTGQGVNPLNDDRELRDFV